MSSTEETTLARALANPEKSVRDKTISTLRAYVKSMQLSDLEMLKLWKALYFCLWLSDKQPVQLELAQNLASLLPACADDDGSMQFLTMFYRTMMREWSLLDQYRVNKFYSLFRVMLKETFVMLAKRKWPASLTSRAMSVLLDEVMRKTPNGPRMHICDIFFAELFGATNGALSSEQAMLLVQPLLNLLAVSNDSSFRERLLQRVFVQYLERHASELLKKDEGGAEGGGDETKAVFKHVSTKMMQAAVFKAASDDKTFEGNRRKLYDLHIAFQKTTGVHFVDEESLEQASSSSAGASAVVDAVAVTKGGKKNKAAAKGATITTTTVAAVPPAQEAAAVAAAATVVVSAQPSATVAAVTPVLGKAAVGSKVESKKRKQTEESEAVKPQDTKKAKKKEAGPNTPQSLTSEEAQAAANTLLNSTTTSPPILALYIESKKFAGRKVGYSFKKGDKGIGYYIDQVQQKQLEKQRIKTNEKNASTSEKKKGKAPSSSSSTSEKDRRVSFGKDQYKDHLSSIEALQKASPVLPEPPKSVLKSSSAKKSPSKSSSPATSDDTIDRIVSASSTKGGGGKQGGGGKRK